MFGEGNRARAAQVQFVSVGSAQLPLHFVHHRRARRYVLRVRRDGSVRVTIPRGGTVEFASAFACKHQAWIERQWHQRQAEAQRVRAWQDGTEILFRGEKVPLRARVCDGLQVVEFADQTLSAPAETLDLRSTIEHHLRSLAERELLPRTMELAAQNDVRPVRVVVRSQRSRWGSCSPKGTISLNWRLIQAPPFVRDYLIVHELMHLRQMNHSARFWRLVETACPGYTAAEAWLNGHAHLLR